MAPVIPVSLSPHVAILTSPDLDDLLKSSSLPSLPHILQSFSPLPQVTTRTTALVSVLHPSFALRFSDLHEIEDACREDDDRRAERAIDWITARISHRCTKWVQDMERTPDKDALRTPWWDDLRRCVEGDFVPSKTEGWNHPVAVILAASTTTTNPLQVITSLHSRSNQLPSWVDSTFLRYTLIIHPKDSALSDEEATALYNAVKKQFGLHSYLLPLALPKPPPSPVPVPALYPRLPPPPTSEGTPIKTPLTPNVPAGPSVLNTLCMAEGDIQQTARFTREFVVMSLVPWMEKCVLEWNENFSSTRRLPSRLFSSTRRLFGSPSPSPSPAPVNSLAVNQQRSSTLPPAIDEPLPPSQIRRLAEFSTTLGDIRLAVTVWETLRRDLKGGSDILPLFLSPSASMKHHAQAALMSINVNLMDMSPHAQMRALTSAVRWEAGISTPDFLDNEVEGERWLVWAASNAEEAPSALLLAQAALLSTRKQAWRKAALWYALAAARLEKCGIKPLTMYFLRKVQELYTNRPPKELSPSFWDSEGQLSTNTEGLESIMVGIEHPLGRLLYTAGDIAGAVRLFLGLLRSASASPDLTGSDGDDTLKVPSSDKLYLDDFRVAFRYLKSTEPDKIITSNLELSVKFCDSNLSRPRYSGDSDDHPAIWSHRQGSWESYWKSTGGTETVTPAEKFTTNEFFWIDLTLQNPLDADISLTNISLIVQEAVTNSMADFVEVEIVKEVLLRAKDSLVVPISLMSTRPAKLTITHAVYEFVSLLPVKESLACRGRRLNDTPSQRQTPTYTPDILMEVDIVPSDHRLTVGVVNKEELVFLQGEIRSWKLWLTNSGTNPISEIWMVSGNEDEIWVGLEDIFLDPPTETETIKSCNVLKPCAPFRIPLTAANIQPGESMEVPIILHSEDLGIHKLCLLFTFRAHSSQPFFSTRLSKDYHVRSLFDASANACPSSSQKDSYIIELDVTSTAQMAEAEITDIACLSPQWRCHALTQSERPLSGSCRFLLGASPWLEGHASQEVHNFVLRNMTRFLKVPDVNLPLPTAIDLLCSHTLKKPQKSSTGNAAIKSFIHSSRCKYLSHHVARQYSSIPPALHHYIFPLYNPATLDFVIFWEIPSEKRFGHTNLHGVMLGAAHGALDNLIGEVENMKVTKGMFAETRRENMQALEAIKKGEWNLEMNPVLLFVQGQSAKAHNFSQGPCHVPAQFILRNHSLERPARYILRLQSDAAASPGSLPPSYTGRLTFRGEIAPSQTATVQTKLWVTHPGTYSLTGWSLETEITDTLSGTKRYWQQASLDESTSVVVCDSRTL